MRELTSDVRRAYAIFGLQPDVGLRQVRRRYRALVKRWHPDRYTTDIVGQKDASERMRQINVAYVTLVRFLQPDNKRLQFESSLTSKMSSADSLTQEEIDGMVHAIGFEGPMDRFLCGVDTARGILWLVFVVGVVIRLVMLLVSGDFHGILPPPTFQNSGTF